MLNQQANNIPSKKRKSNNTASSVKKRKRYICPTRQGAKEYLDGQYRQAIDTFTKCIQDYKKIIDNFDKLNDKHGKEIYSYNQIPLSLDEVLFLLGHSYYLVAENRIDNGQALLHYTKALVYFVDEELDNNKQYLDEELLDEYLSYIDEDIDNLEININSNSSKYFSLSFEIGRVLIELERYETAITAFTVSIDRSELNDSHYYRRGMAYYYNEDLDNAIIDFSSAIDNYSKRSQKALDPTVLYDYYLDRGTAYFNLGKSDSTNFNKAIDDYNEAIKLFDNNKIDRAVHVAYHNRGLDQLGLSEYIKARADFEQAIEKAKTQNSMDSRYYFYLGNTYYYKNEIPTALIYYDKAIQIEEEDEAKARYYDMKSNGLFYEEEYEQAISAYDSAIELQEKNSPAWHDYYFNRGHAYFRWQKYQALKRILRKQLLALKGMSKLKIISI